MIAAYVDSRPPEPLGGVAAEKITEAELLDLMRKHCQKSWQATRWLLEMKFPEKYGKRKANATTVPSVDQVFAAVSGVLTEEIADEALRARIEARLDSLAAQAFSDTSVPATQRKPNEDSEVEANIEAEANAESIEQPQSSEEPKPWDDTQSPEPGKPELLQPVELETFAEHPSREPANVPTSPVARPVAVTPLARPIEKPPPSPPTTWMSLARQQNEERKRSRELRKQGRKKQRK